MESRIKEYETQVESLVNELKNKDKRNESMEVKIKEARRELEICLEKNEKALERIDVLNGKISALENEKIEKNERMILISEENKILRTELQKKDDEGIQVDTEILIEKCEVAVNQAMKEFIFSEDETKNLSKDFLMKMLEDNYSKYNKIIEKLWVLKWEVGKQEKAYNENEDLKLIKRKVILTIEEVNESKELIKREIKERQYSIFNHKVDFLKLVDLPTFDAINIHFYLFKDQFKIFLKNANIPFTEGSPYLYKSLKGRPLQNVQNEFQGFVSDIDKIFLCLQKYHGSMDIILEEIINKLIEIGNIPSNVSSKWRVILEKSNQTIKIINSLKSLERVDKDVIHHHPSLERIFKNLVSNEHFQLLEQKQMKNSKGLLDNVLDVLSINKEQAISKLRNEEKNQASMENTPISFLSTNQKTLAHSHGKYFLSNLPQHGIYCSLCEKFPQSDDQNCHILCKTKFSYYLVQVSCFHLRRKTTFQRYKFLENINACLKCLKISPHSTEQCRLTKSKKYMRCVDENCNLNFIICYEHKDKNQEKFTTLNRITGELGISVAL